MEIFHFSSTKLHRDPIWNITLMVILFYGAIDKQTKVKQRANVNGVSF